LCRNADASKERRQGAGSEPAAVALPVADNPPKFAAGSERTMATIEVATQRRYVATPPRGPVTRLLEDERWLASMLLLPTVALLGLFIAYPFVKGVLLAVTDTKVGVPGQFVGFANFEKLWHDDIFHVAVYNTFIYTFVTTVFKLALGLWLALLLNRHFRGKAFVRAFILLPFIIPTVLSTFAWKWMFDPTFSVLNWMLFRLGMITGRINWLGDPQLAMISVIIVNVWRGVPFYAISLLAGLQTISPELHEAAAIDGARPWNRFRHVTWPLLLPVTMVVVLFSVIQTFADFQLVYVLTGGGPANATQLFATYAYQIGVGTGLLSQGAAVSLAIFPVLLLVVIIQLLYIRKVETH
jgi:multiple sugar transport system permease protein